MNSVFYDLETTDKLPIGQILNFAFIEVDKDFNVIDKFCDNIKISRLQLPSPEAILKNRTNVIEHQAKAVLTEKVAVRNIWEFLNQALKRAKGQLALVGFNSNSFDIDYLRTTFIRNGVSPYLRGLQLRDLYHASQWLSIFHPDFPRTAKQGAVGEEEGNLKLTLENLTQRLGLLEGVQLHSSEDDVLLTVELAKTYLTRFGLDIRSFESYQAGKLHNAKRGTVFSYYKPNRDLFSECKAETSPYVLLEGNQRNALWVDLEKYRTKPEKSSIRWFSGAKTPFFSDGVPVEFEQYQQLAAAALKDFESVNLGNFFDETTCDIESHIYRLDFAQIDLLGQIIWQSQTTLKPELPDTKTVLLRYKLANYQAGTEHDKIFETKLKDYALYRYGGKCVVAKNYREHEWESEKNPFHPTFKQMLTSLEAKLSAADISTEDRDLLTDLKKFYLESDIYRVTGALLHEN